MKSGSKNEALVLASIRRRSGHAREIAKSTGLEIHTVNSILGRLLERKEIVSLGTQCSDGGRPRRIYGATGTGVDEQKQSPDVPLAEQIRIAQRITVPQYHSNGWSRLG